MTARQMKSAPYEVGYGKPPRHTQFRKGQSGNPGGRPRRTATERANALLLGEAYRLVTVKMDGQKQITEIRIDPEVFAGKDQELMQDLVRAAVNEAGRRVDEELASQMKRLTGGIPGMAGLKIPGLF